MAGTGGQRDTERRPLRVFAFDPMVDRHRPPVVLKVPYEIVGPGPAGRLIEVVDHVRSRAYDPIDLDDPRVMIGSGLTPAEYDYKSHQQMVYAVAMVVLEAFERGLGRPILWHAGKPLRLVPHAGTMQNAFFLPRPEFALAFGAFAADRNDPGGIGGQTIYTCLSWDVIAHETSHPVLLDIRPFDVARRDEGSSPDVDAVESAAIHEGMCDLVALLVRLTNSAAVTPMIERHHLDLEGTALLQLAPQFASAIGVGAGLRTFPGPEERSDAEEPHVLGSQLTSAVIVALLGAVREQCRDLFGLHGPPRVAGPPSRGGGSTKGWLHPDLVARLAGTVTVAARQALDTCIGALDLLPPFDARFGDFLRAAITVSVDRFGADGEVFRAGLIDAFKSRRMLPPDVDSLSVDALHLSSDSVSLMKPRAKEPLLPHVDEALLLTQHALELRRACMTDAALIPGAQAVVDADLRLLQGWEKDVAAWAQRLPTRVRLEPSAPTFARNLTGSFGTDPGAHIRGRVTVQIEQPARPGSPRRGITVVATSTGDVEYVIPSGDARRKTGARTWPYHRATDHLDLTEAF